MPVTVIHVVGYNGDTTPTAPAGDTTRTNTTAVLASQLLSDTYQSRPGASTTATATSSLAQASEAITIAIEPATTVQRLGYSGQTDSSGFTQNTSGSIQGVTIGLAGGITYNTTPASKAWAYTNNHGDTITTTDNIGNTTWTGYWGPYGEMPTSSSPPSDTALTGSSFGYNGAQGKLTETPAGITLMGARPYQSSSGRFTHPTPSKAAAPISILMRSVIPSISPT